MRAAIAKAKRSVFILGWDFDNRTRLVPQGARDGYPEELGDFLNEVVRRNRELEPNVGWLIIEYSRVMENTPFADDWQGRVEEWRQEGNDY